MAFFPDCLKVKLSSSLPDFVTSYDQSEVDSEGLFSLIRPPPPPHPHPQPRVIILRDFYRVFVVYILLHD